MRLCAAILVLLCRSYVSGTVIPAASTHGQKLLRQATSRATVVRHSRNLNDESSIGNTVTGTDVGIELSDYNIQYLGCENHASQTENGVVTNQQLVQFALCPSKSSSCSSCSSMGGKYVVDMKDFIEPYTKSKLNCYNFSYYQCAFTRNRQPAAGRDNNEARSCSSF